MLVFVLLGLLVAPGLQRETYPQFDADTIRISASYPGADAEIIDETLVQGIEDAISGLDGVDSITSQAREGAASITVEVEDGAAVAEVLADIKSALDGLREWPEDIDRPVASATSRRAAVASVAVSGPMSPGDLKLYCEQLRRELLRDPQVSQVSVAGFSTHRLLIQLKQAALIRHGLGLSDVAAAVAAQSLDTPIGTIERAAGDVLLRYSDERTSVAGLAEIVVKSAATGGEVRVGDLGEVRDTFAVEEEQTQVNGARACTLGISKTAWQDSLDVLAAVEAFLADQERRKPPGVALTLTQNVAAAVQDQIDLLLMNALQGLLLVFFTLWLFFHLRLAFWVAIGLPVSVLGALALMSLLGQTINMMTMMAMLIALGLVMDDAIVLADNFAAHRERGKSAMDAAVDAVKEVSGGVVASFLTTACVFIPLASIDGRIGRVLQVIPVILIAVLAVSLIEAFFVLPEPPRALDAARRPEPRRAAFARPSIACFATGSASAGSAASVDLAVRWRWADARPGGRGA
jgi:HAE1 family hydrophobic/amphiphilic exporter-1